MTHPARTEWPRGVALLLAVATVVLLVGVTRSDADSMPRCGWTGKPPRLATDHELRTSVLCLVNRIRAHRGIAPLEFSADLRRSATVHSKNMVRSRSLSHYGPDGSTPLVRIAKTGYLARAATYRLAENIGAGFGRSYGSPRAIVRGWMRSPGHRANVLSRSLRDFGVGIARGDPFGRDGNAATYTLDLGARR